MGDNFVFDLLDDLEGHANPHTTDYLTRSSSDSFGDSCQSMKSHEPHSNGLQNTSHGHYGNTIEVFSPGDFFDDFDRSLLQQPDDDRRRQAQEGRARLSLPPAGRTHAYTRPAPAIQEHNNPAQQNRGFEVPPSAVPQVPETSSSPRMLPSSPTVRASQRRQSSTALPQRPRRDKDVEVHVAGNNEEGFQPEFMVNTGTQPAKRNDAPVVQGIELVSTRELPDRFRSVFPFPLFNAVQSKCFNSVYRTNDNFVVSSPTGSGKTALFELAILRLVNGYPNGSFKAVYQAPTKALCFERYKDWEKKLGPLGLKVSELTGDTTLDHVRDVQTADVIITTPEKWDSTTRRWKDHERLMQLVKLFLIDEVHILKEDRGATLEAVVSRMKSVGSDVRFVALSATVPNFADIATWLGKDPMNQHIPAPKERFDEDFRPVKLQKHVVGFTGNQIDFGFDRTLNQRLPMVIAKYSQKKPIMIFCFTRKSCEETAKFLANWWAQNGPQERYWEQPRRLPYLEEVELRSCAVSGVAFHHAGLSSNDRQSVEKGFLGGDINVICCTSTLAVGINLPCHFVIIKNTVSYTHPNITREYSDLEIIQMLGRAGRPQFDDSAVAVIITRSEKVKRYEMMMSGKEILESRLHLNLIEHLNAEIGLRTVTDTGSAKRWLTSTFLYVRLKENPGHYKIEGDVPSHSLDERVEHICSRAIELLRFADLAKGDPQVELTENGDIMARYYVRLETMKSFLGMQPQAKLSEILSTMACADEFKEIRFRQGEKALYKILNQSPAIKFSIPVNLDQTPHKVSLIIQSVLGGVDLPMDENLAKQRAQHNQDTNLVFQHVRRMIRCIADLAIKKDDSIMARNALLLSRSLVSRVWDDSPLTMKQIESIGPVGVRKLANAGVRSIEDIEYMEPQRIETVLGKHPPYGMTVLAKVRDFPKLHISLKQMECVGTDAGQAVTVHLKAEIGFMNEKPPLTFPRGNTRTPIFICLLAETSDGKLAHFRRTSASKLGNGQKVLFSAELTSLNQVVTCFIMCDDIAGTMRHATIQPQIPAYLQERLRMNISRRRADRAQPPPMLNKNTGSDEFDDGGLEDSDFDKAIHDGGFVDIDTIPAENTWNPSGAGKKSMKKNAEATARTKLSDAAEPPANDDTWEPKRLRNGKWACNHPCKNKLKCRHLCCKEGLDRAPKAPKGPRTSKPTGQEDGNGTQRGKRSPTNRNLITGAKTQTWLNPSRGGRNTGTGTSRNIEHMDLTGTDSQRAPQAHQGLKKLRPEAKRTLFETTPVSSLISNKKPRHSYESGEPLRLSFLQKEEEQPNNVPVTSDYDDIDLENMSTQTYGNASHSGYSQQHDDGHMFHEDGDLFGDVMAGIAFLAEHGDIPMPTAPSQPAQNQPRVNNAAALGNAGPQKQKGPFLSSSRSPSPGQQRPQPPLPSPRPLERSTTEPPSSAGTESTSSMRSTRVPRKPLRSLETQSLRSESTSSKLRVMNPDPLSPEEPSPVTVPPGCEDVDPWLIREFGAYVNFT